jgi:hypothetical protein
MTRKIMIAFALMAGSATTAFANSDVATGRGYVDLLSYKTEQGDPRYSGVETQRAEDRDIVSRGARDAATFRNIDVENRAMGDGGEISSGFSGRAKRR